jgi:hypothetical protein
MVPGRARQPAGPCRSAHGMPAVDELLRSEDTHDPVANWARWLLLLLHIPPDTEWYEVQNLTDAELDELRVIYRCGWDNPSHRNELRRVAALMPNPLKKPFSRWERSILWGHGVNGPFTMIEGNNRLIGYASHDLKPELSISVLIGLSPQPCATWHILDAQG